MGASDALRFLKVKAYMIPLFARLFNPLSWADIVNSKPLDWGIANRTRMTCVKESTGVGNGRKTPPRHPGAEFRVCIQIRL